MELTPYIFNTGMIDHWKRATKTDNVVEYYEFTENHRKMSVNTWGIIGKWGETFDGIENVQRVDYGDFICRQVDDHADQWVVRRKLFLNTYEMLT